MMWLCCGGVVVVVVEMCATCKKVSKEQVLLVYVARAAEDTHPLLVATRPRPLCVQLLSSGVPERIRPNRM